MRNIFIKAKTYMHSLNNKDFFLVICLFQIGLFFAYNIIFGPRMFEWLNMENNSNWTQLDFFYPILSSQKLRVTYTEIGAQYPPISHIIFSLFAKMLNIRGKEISFLMAYEISQYPYAQMLYSVYICFCFLLYAYAISELKIEKRYRIGLTISVLFSTPMFAGALERGNMVLLAGGFLLIAIVWKNSDKKWKQEMALILIALSASIKIYPAVFGILYLKKNSIFQAFRLMVYGILFLMCPFLLFEKGSFIAFINNNVKVMAQDSIGRIQCFQGVLQTFGISTEISQILNALLIILLVICAFSSKSIIRKTVYLSSLMMYIPTNQYRYMLLFYLIPLLYLFENRDCHISKSEIWIDTILLMFVFAIPMLQGQLTHFELNFHMYTLTYVEVFIYTAGWSVLLAQFIFDIIDFVKYINTIKNKSV